MKLLYLECNMGAAGDMLTAALSELVPEADMLLQKICLPGVQISRETVTRCGISGTSVSVKIHGTEEESCDVHTHPQEHHEHHHERHHEQHHTHHHATLADITRIIHELDIPENVKEQALSVYRLLAEAEGQAHGCTVEEIHFHEVGTLDAVADITAVCLLLDAIAPDRIVVSPVCTGFGQVRCAHGILPVPAPATAYLLRDMPVFAGQVEGELCTPTGAALLRHFADECGHMPAMRIRGTGYGMGKKAFSAANCVRAFLGETDAAGQVVELKCDLDDMTGEQLGYAVTKLMQTGALDVFTTAIGMKKNRPGILLTVLCAEEQRERLVREIFRHTTTLGIRETVCRRYTLDRKETAMETPCGTVRCKEADGYGVTRCKPEFDDLAKLAEERGRSVLDLSD